ncbi:MAG: succinyl-diaminopimelate desuccinylase [Burkholderiales bacterium]|nr:succinyl-diaminopimelate desuccinylase [Burkholderiales bacterium]
MNAPGDAGADTLALAKQLIACRSVSPEDGGCQEIIAGRLRACGFTVEHMPRGNVLNLLARRGAGAPGVCFAGHTDVVPPGPLTQWLHDPFSPFERDGRLYGRGAADMKTSIAAFVTAIERFVGAHPEHPGTIVLMITSDEEADAVDGTARIVEALAARGESLDYCIVGEPTCEQRFGDTLKNGRRGSLSGTLRVHGIQGHVAYPHLARNPIHQAAPALAELAAIRWDEGDEDFPPTTWQASNIHGGTGASNVIPAEVSVQFNFRFGAATPPETLKRRVHELLDRHGLEYELQWTVSAVPYMTPRGRLLEAARAAIREVTGVDPAVSTSGGTSDGRFIVAVAREIVEFGPLNESIHKLNEYVPLADSEPLSRVYELLLGRLLRPR